MFIVLYRYSLAEEHGDLINLHDWFQSFKTIILHHRSNRKQKSKQSPLKKKRKDTNASRDPSEASIQYPLDFPLCRVYLIYFTLRYNALNVLMDVANCSPKDIVSLISFTCEEIAGHFPNFMVLSLYKLVLEWYFTQLYSFVFLFFFSLFVMGL